MSTLMSNATSLRVILSRVEAPTTKLIQARLVTPFTKRIFLERDTTYEKDGVSIPDKRDETPASCGRGTETRVPRLRRIL